MWRPRSPDAERERWVRGCGSRSCGFADGPIIIIVGPFPPNRRRSAASNPLDHQSIFLDLVGARGFEPPTPASRTQCATGLRYAPTCEPTHEERDSVLQQDGGKRQAMRFGHSLTSHLAVVEIDSLRKTGVRTNSPLKPFRSQAEYEG